jgi:hypothetical protein
VQSGSVDAQVAVMARPPIRTTSCRCRGAHPGRSGRRDADVAEKVLPPLTASKTTGRIGGRDKSPVERGSPLLAISCRGLAYKSGRESKTDFSHQVSMDMVPSMAM